jgi:hypothetical protein
MIWCLVHHASKHNLILSISLDFYSRPSTPIEEVIRHSFAEKWIEAMANRQADYKKSQMDNTVGQKTRSI